MDVVLQRLPKNDNVMFGVILVDSVPRFVTLEPPWNDNQHNISCVPAGTYKVVKIHSPRFNKDVFMMIDIPGRDAVEFHVGNGIQDTHGCVLLGLQFSLSDYAIVNSGIAFDNFMKMMPNEGFTITIKDSEDVKTTTTSQV